MESLNHCRSTHGKLVNYKCKTSIEARAIENIAMPFLFEKIRL